MMNYKFIFSGLIILFTSISSHLKGQESEGETVYMCEIICLIDICFHTPKDSIKFCKKSLRYSSWLASTSEYRHLKKREKINAYLIGFQGCKSDFSVDIPLSLWELQRNKPNLMAILFAGAYTYKILHPSTIDDLILLEEGLKFLLKVYEKGLLKQDEFLDHLYKLYQNNQLQSWLSTEIALNSD